MSNYAYVHNGIITELRDTLPKCWQNVSGLDLSANNEIFLNNLGWYTIQHNTPVFDPALQYISDWNYLFTGSAVTADAVLTIKPAEDPLAYRVNMKCTPYQCKVVLMQAGLLDQVNAMLADPGADALAKLAWSEAIEFRRLDANIIGMGAALGLSETQLDDMFRQAMSVGV